MRDYDTTAVILRGIAAVFRAQDNHHAARICDDAADAIEELLAAVPRVHCGECKFWDSPSSCEGLAKCVTGETGIRYRSKNDFCSKGMPLPEPPKEEKREI